MVFSRRVFQTLIVAVVLSLSMVLVFGVWKGKSRQAQQAMPEASATSDSEMKLTDMELTEMQEGKRFWTLSAAEAKYFQDEQKTRLREVCLVFLSDKGDEIRLESKEGVLYAGSKRIELSDEVKMTLPRGYTMSTERAAYDHQAKLISSDTPIRISGPEIQLEGVRWQYRIPDHVAVIDGGVKASISLENGNQKQDNGQRISGSPKSEVAGHK